MKKRITVGLLTAGLAMAMLPGVVNAESPDVVLKGPNPTYNWYGFDWPWVPPGQAGGLLICPLIFDPVHTPSGEVWSNPCFAVKAGVRVFSLGAD
jgi:hypothetical protein